MTKFSTRETMKAEEAYTVTFFVEHEGSNGPSLVGAVSGLTPDTNGGTTTAVLVLGSGDGTSRHRHDGEVVW